METVLILGGTKEAAELAALLVAAHPDWRVITSLAGRTREPSPVAGEVRIGGFGGAQGLAEYLKAEKIARLIDATHPFAKRISANAKRAAADAGVPLEIRKREPWQKLPGDNWMETATLDAARNAIPSGARVLLALGSQHIASFAMRADVHFVVRMVDAPLAPLPLPDHELIIGKPANTAEAEIDLLRRHAITHIVCRNSGGAGAYAKIEAARTMRLPVIVIASNSSAESTRMRRSIFNVTLVVPDYDEAIAFYAGKLGFEVAEDTELSAGKRWVVVTPTGGNGAGLLLAKADGPIQRAAIGDQAGGRVFLFLSTDDFERDYELFRAAGVDFLETPRLEPYGKVAVFADPFGNKWDLIQHSRQEEGR